MQVWIVSDDCGKIFGVYATLQAAIDATTLMGHPQYYLDGQHVPRTCGRTPDRVYGWSAIPDEDGKVFVSMRPYSVKS